MWDREDEVELSRASDCAGMPRIVLLVSPAFGDCILGKIKRPGIGFLDHAQGDGFFAKSGRDRHRLSLQYGL